METKKPRWEVKYEKYLSEEPVKEKITKMERSSRAKISAIKRKINSQVAGLSAEIEALKNEKVTGDFKTKEEYEQAVAEHQELIASKEREIESIKNNPETDKKIEELKNNQELEGYKNFEMNKEKIKNILEYRNTLQKRLEEMPENTAEVLANKKQEQEGRASRIAQYQTEIENLKQQLKQEIPQEERQILLFTLKTKLESMGNLQAEQSKADLELADLEKSGVNFDNKAQDKKETLERKIAKCNIIAAQLLKGKSLDELELKVDTEGKKYTSPDGKLPAEVDKARREYQKEAPVVGTKAEEKQQNNQIATVSSFAQKYPRLAKIGNFFKNLKDKVVEFFKDDELDKIDATIEKEGNDKFEQIAKEAMQGREAKSEDELLKSIAEKGAEKTFRERLSVNTKNAANNYAIKYGNTYERQDGATAKKETNKSER